MPYGGGYRRGGSGGGRGGGFRSFVSQPTKITCSECGKEDEVPFKPREGTPVYCKECFFKKKGITPRGRDRPEQTETPETEKSEKSEESSEETEESTEESE